MERTSQGQAIAGIIAILAVAAAMACSQPSEPGPPFKPVASIHDLMHDVVYPHAEVVWDSVGTIIDQEGTHEIRPGNEHQWERVMQSALTVAEAGNLLMMEGRAKDTDDWMRHAAALIDAATLAIEAANNRDADAVFDIGGEIYYACNNCHEQYWEKPPSAMRP